MIANPPESVRQTLLRAIQIEARNAGLYNALAKIFEGYNDSVTEIFQEMAEEELRHGAELRERYRARFGPVPRLHLDPLDFVESPDLEDPEALVFDAMSIENAIEVGLRAEEAARKFYLNEIVRSSDAELRKIYLELAEFEASHVRKLQDKLEERRKLATPSPR